VFFGGYAASLYSQYMPKKERAQVNTIPDFDMLSENPMSSALILKEQLNYEGFKNVVIRKKKPIGEYVDDHYEIIVNNDAIAFIYKTVACHSYNVLTLQGRKIKVASIDTILSFYLIFIYANRPYYDENRLLCLSEYLFKVQIKNRLEQRGLLKRFSVTCYGKQQTLEDIREEKVKIYDKVKSNELSRKSRLYNMNFFRYIPKEGFKKTIKYKFTKTKVGKSRLSKRK
jgi:hypothetical protein